MELHELNYQDVKAIMSMADDMSRDGSTQVIVYLHGVRYTVDVLDSTTVVDAEYIGA